MVKVAVQPNGGMRGAVLLELLTNGFEKIQAPQARRKDVAVGLASPLEETGLVDPKPGFLVSSKMDAERCLILGHVAFPSCRTFAITGGWLRRGPGLARLAPGEPAVDSQGRDRAVRPVHDEMDSSRGTVGIEVPDRLFGLKAQEKEEESACIVQP